MHRNPHTRIEDCADTRTREEVAAMERVKRSAAILHAEERRARRNTRQALRETLRELTYASLDLNSDTLALLG